MTEHQVLFCPFCGDSFEGHTTCPAHELSLVPFHRLGRPRDPADDDEHNATNAALDPEDTRELALLEPRYGRLPVACAALLLAVAMPLGLVQVGELSVPAFEVAARLPSLWTWPLVSFCALYLLYRRRTLRALWGLRVVVPWLGFIALLTLALAMARLGAQVRGPAAYAVAVGGLLLGGFGLRLGGVSKRA